MFVFAALRSGLIPVTIQSVYIAPFFRIARGLLVLKIFIDPLFSI